MIIESTDNKYFFCYSKQLSTYLILRNHKYITKAIHRDTMKLFHLFEVNEELKKDLKEFSEKRGVKHTSNKSK
jgi:hypothetical protein